MKKPRIRLYITMFAITAATVLFLGAIRDTGQWVHDSNISDVGHYITFGEAVVSSLPASLTVAAIVTAATAAVVVIRSKKNKE